MKIDPKNQCAREMLQDNKCLLQSQENYENDEVGILSSFIDNNPEIRSKFAEWLEDYIVEYIKLNPDPYLE